MAMQFLLQLLASLLIYTFSVSAVPIYNKAIFSGHGDKLKKFPYPIATTFLQLGCVGGFLALCSALRHVWYGRKAEESWLFGPHFKYKLRHIAPVGVLFGIKHGITNLGLEMVPVGVHVLLQSSDLAWTLLAAMVLNGESPGVLEQTSALLSTVGSLLIASDAVHTLSASTLGILVNLLTPLMLALCVSTLRTGAQELFRFDNRLGGTMTKFEFVAIKMCISSVCALAMSLVLETGALPGQGQAWWTALGEESVVGIVAVMFGSVFTLVFQVNLTWLAAVTSALTVGIIGGAKVLPQWGLNALVGGTLHWSRTHVIGVLCVLLASLLYGLSNCLSHELVLRRSGFRWRPKDQDEERLGLQPLLEGGDEDLEPLAPLPSKLSSAPALFHTGRVQKLRRYQSTTDMMLDVPYFIEVKPASVPTPKEMTRGFTRRLSSLLNRAATSYV